MPGPRRATQAFTLLELVVVVAILATLAGGVVATMEGVEDQANDDLALRELTEVKRAVLAFRADTGHLPRQGPFALVGAGGAVPLPAEGAAWFESPANLTQLYEDPLLGTGHALAAWDPDRRRGWRGPYLPRGAEGRVAVPDGLAADGSAWTPTRTLPLLPAVADPFRRAPTTLGGVAAFAWTTWSGDALERQGRPYLLFDLDDPRHARVVGLGPDGAYSPVAPAVDRLVAPGSDDVGVYLLR